MGRQHLYQHEPVTPPSDWNNEERGMVQRIEHLFDDVYQKLGKVRAQIAGLKGEELPDFDQFAKKDEVEQALSEKANVDDIPDVPDIPTEVSAFKNDVPYLTEDDIPKNLSEFNNDVPFGKNWTLLWDLTNQPIQNRFVFTDSPDNYDYFALVFVREVFIIKRGAGSTILYYSNTSNMTRLYFAVVSFTWNSNGFTGKLERAAFINLPTATGNVTGGTSTSTYNIYRIWGIKVMP